MTAPATDSLSGIVGRLTKAQRWALERGDETEIAHSTTPACRCKLQEKGIVVNRQYSTTLTPLGKSVRDLVVFGRLPAIRQHMEKES